MPIHSKHISATPAAGKGSGTPDTLPVSEKKRRGFFLLSFLLMLAGCTPLIVGAVYNSGELTKQYPATNEQTLKACFDTLKNLNLPVTESFSGGITTQIKAQWPDGTPIMVKIVMKTFRITEVSIRSGAVGVIDKNASEMIHDRIAERLHLFF